MIIVIKYNYCKRCVVFYHHTHMMCVYKERPARRNVTGDKNSCCNRQREGKCIRISNTNVKLYTINIISDNELFNLYQERCCRSP